MKTESEYDIVTNERLEKLGYRGQNKVTIMMLLYWSYVEGSLDEGDDQLGRIKCQ